jgi:hypothetical protein
MIKRLERLKNTVINIWPTYDQIDLPRVSHNGRQSKSDTHSRDRKDRIPLTRLIVCLRESRHLVEQGACER